MARKVSALAKDPVNLDQPPVPQIISIPERNIQTIRLPLIGDSELIVHAWSKQAKIAVAEGPVSQDGPAKPVKRQPKPPRDPAQEYEDSLYRHADGSYGMPGGAFKSAFVDSMVHLDLMSMAKARGVLHVVDEIVKIHGEPRMRTDAVRIPTTQGGIMRYRGGFPVWSCTLTVRFNASIISAPQIAAVFDTAGFAIGVGDWRPQKNGDFGRFHVKRG